MGLLVKRDRIAFFIYNEYTLKVFFRQQPYRNGDAKGLEIELIDGFSERKIGVSVMFCLEQAIHNSFCHNVSYDDLGGTISPSGNPDAYIAHNTFYVRKDVPFVRNQMDDGNFVEEENTFIDL